jgi:adenosylcobyric acid synthase
MGLLDITTTFDRVKTTRRVEAAVAPGAGFLTQTPLRGYEIHMGRSTGSIGLFRIAGQEGMLDGSAKESVWGTYLHGIFDNDAFRRELIDSLRIRAGHAPRGEIVRYGEERSAALDRWAGILQERLDMRFIERLAGL